MTHHNGSCLCGAVTFEIEGSFDSFYLCHCQYCQKDMGSAHAANLFSQSATLRWLSGAETVRQFTLAGTQHSRSFCQLCGSALPGAQASGLLVVPAGSLDTNLAMLPTAHLFTSCKAAWDDDLSGVPAFERLPE